ncbi:dephospho-CoA kinase [Kitasatospora sp. NPDC049285]|uniref:dephospho-CoA kinase n=1 Tax=Kitasatospora sp. NPDC049285 TaxID=3157096 RepID=UPI003444E99F
MLRIGLTGGIGAGKSEVSRQLAALGAVIVDADLIAREVVAPGTPGLAAVAAEFGPGVLLPDGSLDRPALGRLVFGDPARLAVLNAIVHPLVRERSAELEAAAGPDAIVVNDVPLLAENGLAPLYDLVVVVDVPDEQRLLRLVELRGMAEDEAKARMAAQATREDRLAVADVVLDNSGTLEQLTERVGRLWQELGERQAAARG